MRIRIRGPAGQFTLSLPETATVRDLQSQIAKKVCITTFDLKHGYPPKPLSLDLFEGATQLQHIGINLDGEQLIINEITKPTHDALPEKASIPSQSNKHPIHSTLDTSNGSTSASFSFADVGAAPSSSLKSPYKALPLARKPTVSEMDAPEVPLPTYGATMVLRIMPDDNSCLFRAFNSAFFGAMDNMHELRSIIAQHIQANQDTYSAVVLEKDPDDYCRWIQTGDAWGGAIELDILSQHFGVEICSIDIQTLRVDKYNEAAPLRCILVYSGIHYDAIAISPSNPPHDVARASPDHDTKVFDSNDALVLDAATELCRVLQGKHYYTDTASFKVRCNVCGKVSVGEQGATEHAVQTGHYDFGEAE